MVVKKKTIQVIKKKEDAENNKNVDNNGDEGGDNEEEGEKDGVEKQEGEEEEEVIEKVIEEVEYIKAEEKKFDFEQYFLQYVSDVFFDICSMEIISSLSLNMPCALHHVTHTGKQQSH
jgi:hypothetical protein